MNTRVISKNPVDLLIEMVQSHSAWHDQTNGEEAEKILRSYPRYSYLLRRGENEFHYFLTYISHEFLVLHKSIRINSELLGYYPNGGADCDRTNIYHTVEQLISEFLGCHPDDLLPLPNQLAYAQGF